MPASDSLSKRENTIHNWLPRFLPVWRIREHWKLQRHSWKGQARSIARLIDGIAGGRGFLECEWRHRLPDKREQVQHSTTKRHRFNIRNLHYVEKMVPSTHWTRTLGLCAIYVYSIDKAGLGDRKAMPASKEKITLWCSGEYRGSGLPNKLRFESQR